MSPTLEPSLKRSSSEKRSWNVVGPYPVMATNSVATGGYHMIFWSSLAYMLAVFVRPNRNRPCGERGRDSGVRLESWRKMLRSENRSKST
jgi:hypothetical protein